MQVPFWAEKHREVKFPERRWNYTFFYKDEGRKPFHPRPVEGPSLRVPVEAGEIRSFGNFATAAPEPFANISQLNLPPGERKTLRRKNGSANQCSSPIVRNSFSPREAFPAIFIT